MNLKKSITLTFFFILILSLGILVSFIFKINGLLEGAQLNTALIDQYNNLQKQTNLISIILFIILLLLGFINYYKYNKANYIALSTLLYVFVTLYCYLSINYRFYELQNINPTESGNFWIFAFIGVFYVVGSILISVIGFYTIRNLLKRNAPKQRLNNKKK